MKDRIDQLEKKFEAEIKKLKEENLKLYYLHRKNIESPKLFKNLTFDYCFKIEKKDLQVKYNNSMENVNLD